MGGCLMIRIVLASFAALAITGCSTSGASLRERGSEWNGAPLSAPAEFLTRIAVDNSQRGTRRELILALLAQSDRDCEDYLIGMAAYRNRVTLNLDIASVGLSAIGGLIKPVETANILSGASTLSQSVQSTVEETLFGGRTQGLIYTAVRQGRQIQRREIMASLNRGDFDGWSATSIAAALDRYHLDCGVSYGLSELESALARLDPGRAPGATP